MKTFKSSIKCIPLLSTLILSQPVRADLVSSLVDIDKLVQEDYPLRNPTEYVDFFHAYKDEYGSKQYILKSTDRAYGLYFNIKPDGAARIIITNGSLSKDEEIKLEPELFTGSENWEFALADNLIRKNFGDIDSNYYSRRVYEINICSYNEEARIIDFGQTAITKLLPSERDGIIGTLESLTLRFKKDLSKDN